MENNLKAPLNKIIKFSNVDGPGNRMAIFFQGCNFDCLYCHNPETINICFSCGDCIKYCPTNSLFKNEVGKVIWNKEGCIGCDNCIKNCKKDSSPKIQIVEISDLMREIEKVKEFIKGITVSGGECTLHYKFLTRLFKKVKSTYPHLTCFVDTNGSLDLSESVYKEFVEVTDNFMLDIKAWKLSELKILGVKSANPLKNLKFLKEKAKLYEVRSVIVPNLLNSEVLVKEVSKDLTSTNIRYKIIKYREIGVRDRNKSKLESPTDDYLHKLERIATDLKVNVILT